MVGRQKHYLPQVKLDAHSTILSDTSRTILKQTFSNPSSSDIKQCTYMFPLYDGVSVVAFTCRIGSRLLQGVVKERSKAKATFDAAVSRGESAGLLEQLPEASDVFSTRLGNIPANEKVHVEITYIGELKHDAQADGIRFTIPTRIAPRYGMVSSSQAIEGSNVQEQGGISITVDASVAERSFIRGIQSPTHPIAVTMGSTSISGNADPAMHQASATLSLGSTELDKDFVLIVLTKETGTPKALLERHPSLPNQQALMLTLVPKFDLPRINPEIVFVADRSGSMEENVPTLISALKVFLKSLPVGVKFNICSYGSHHSFLWPKSQAYSRDSVDAALAHVETFRADYGGTETFQALKATIENRYTDIPCEVMLLTDGDIWDQGSLFTYLHDEVQKSKSGLRIFALGIGDEVSHALIEGVARAGNGFAQSVNNNEKLDAKVIRMLKGGLSPHTTDYSLEVKYEDPNEDFEIVDKVTDMLEVILSDDKVAEKLEAKKENKPISFFTKSTQEAGQEKPPSADNDTTDPFAHLPAVSVPKILQTPQNIPSLFPFSRTSVYLLFSDDSTLKTPKSATLRAKSEHGPLELEIPVEVLSSPGETIHQLAARKAILELEEGRGWIHEAKDKKGTEKLVKEIYPSRFDEMVQREAVRIGVRYQVGGKWCSFVAVKDQDREEDMEKATNKSTEEVWKAEDTEAEMDDASDEDMGYSLFDIEEAAASSPIRNQPSFAPHQQLASVAYRKAPPSSASFASYRPSSPSYSPSSPSLAGYDFDSYDHAMMSTPQFTADLCRSNPPDDEYDAPGRAGPSKKKRALGDSMSRSAVRGGRGGGPPSRYMPGGNTSLAGVPQMYTPSFETYSASQVFPQTNNQKVHAVIALQDFEGWWEQKGELLAILEIEIVETKTKEWITMLVIKWLETKMVGEEDVWELVVEKARGWLEVQYMGEEEMVRLEKEVAEVLR